jgi:hypothetical protein
MGGQSKGSRGRRANVVENKVCLRSNTLAIITCIANRDEGEKSGLRMVVLLERNEHHDSASVAAL